MGSDIQEANEVQWAFSKKVVIWARSSEINGLFTLNSEFRIRNSEFGIQNHYIVTSLLLLQCNRTINRTVDGFGFWNAT